MNAYADDTRYLAKIELHTPAELQDALLRAEALAAEQSPQKPIAFVLHGEEAKSLLKSSYDMNKAMIDQAQRLSQSHIIRLQVCQSWMMMNGVDENELPEFVDTVRFAPYTIHRLISRDGYTYF